jgi:DNA-binding MarR family transcriptional regulator
MSETLPSALNAIAEVCLALRVRRLSRRVSRYYDGALAQLGIDTSQFNILTVIGASAPVALIEVSEALDLDPSTLSRTLKTLRESGLVEAIGGRGRGGLVLSLTSSGQDLMAQAVGVWRAAQEKLSVAVGQADIGRIVEAFDRLDHAATRE